MTMRRVLTNGCVARLIVLGLMFGIAGGAVALYDHFSAPKATPPIVVGKAPSNPTGHIEVPQSFDEDGYANPQDWPNACELLTDQDVRAIFPQVTGAIQHQPKDVHIDVFDTSGLTAGENFDVPDADCEITFHLPNSDNDASYPDLGISKIDVGVDAAGDPNTLLQNIQSDPDTAKQIAQGCTYRAGITDYLCGNIEVDAEIDYLDVADRSQNDKPIDRFQTGGTVHTFDPDSQADTTFEATAINPAIVQAVLAKLPAS